MKHFKTFFSALGMILCSMYMTAQDGNVGIGTTTPATQLEIADTNQVYVRINSTDDSGVGLEFFNTGIGGLMDWRIQTSTGGGMLFQRSPTEFVGLPASKTVAVFTGDDRYGFGTTNPEADFELSSTSLTQMQVTSAGLGGLPSYNLVQGPTPLLSRHWRLGIADADLVFQTGRNNYTADSLEAMRVLETGEVGIGTNDPQQHLEVSGLERQVIRVSSTSGVDDNDAALDLVRQGQASGTDWRIINDGGVLRIMDGIDNFTTDGVENVRIMSSGNVGVNQEIPGARMHITGDDFIDEEDGGNMLKVGFRTHYVAVDNNEIAAKGPGGSSSTLYIQEHGGNLSLAEQTTSRVGVGIDIPQSKLHVSEGQDVSLINNGYLMLGLQTGTNIALDNNEIMARNNGAGASLYLQHDAGDVLLCGNEAGQVGIGITSATFLPTDADYLLAVDGKVICEEAHVELSQGWPDYVFGEDYELRTLDQLEQEIRALGHLPGIPSAQTVESEGLLLGDMQRRMMEKIEELTLYMIEADKVLQRQELQIQQLIEQNLDLSSQLNKMQDHGGQE